MTDKVDPQGEQVEKNFTPTPRFTLFGPTEVKDASPNPRRYDWKTYYDMYERHPIVNSAINKIVKVATNTGFEFKARSATSALVEQQINEVREFFEDLPDFKFQLNMVYQHLEIYGNAFLYVVPNRRRKPSRLKTLAPWTVNVKVNKHGKVLGYYQSDPDSTGEGVYFKPHEIIHIKLPNPKDQVYGLSPLEALKSAVLTDILADNFNRSFFKNGASTGTVFIFNGASESQLERMRKWIEARYVGTENSHLPFVIDGDVKIERSVASHQDMGFENGRDSIRAQILAVLDVPPAKLGYMESANRSNSKEQDKSFRTESIMPLQYLVETALSDQLIRDILGVPNVLINHSDADVRDRQEQMDLWTDGVQNGILNINEVRKMMGYPTIEGGDINYTMTPTGAVPIVDLELYFKIPKNNLATIPEAQHDGHKHPKGDGHIVGPEVKSNPAADQLATLETPANKSIELDLIASLIEKAKADRMVLRHVWSYANDLAEDLPTPEHNLLQKTLTKAVRCDDDLLSLTYVERAQGMVARLT